MGHHHCRCRDLDLVSSYLKPFLDRLFLRYSERWRNRSATRIAKRDAYIAELVRDDEELTSARWHALRYLLNSIWFLVQALPVMVVAFAVPSGPVGLVFQAVALVWLVWCGIISVANIQKMNYDRYAIIEAEVLRREARKANSADEPRR